jgi:hypothetical protein
MWSDRAATAREEWGSLHFIMKAIWGFALAAQPEFLAGTLHAIASSIGPQRESRNSSAKHPIVDR